MTLDEAIKHCEEVAYQKDLESGFDTDNERYAMTDKEKTDCKECASEHRQLAEWLKELKTYKEQSEDAISRSDAVRVASGYCHPANIARELAKLPPAQPKIKTGHWIEGQTNNPNVHNILCSCCFEGYPSKGHANSQYTREKFKYCPNCGAKMIEPQAE